MLDRFWPEYAGPRRFAHTVELGFGKTILLQPALNIVVAVNTAVCQQKIVQCNQANDGISHITRHFARNLIQNGNLSARFERGGTAVQ
jgi:hypothetical protein